MAGCLISTMSDVKYVESTEKNGNKTVDSVSNGDFSNHCAIIPVKKSLDRSFSSQLDYDSLLKEFIHFCETAPISWTEEEKHKIFKLIKRRCREANPQYLLSNYFKECLSSTIRYIKNNLICAFIYIGHLEAELKANKLKNHKRSVESTSAAHEDSAGSNVSRQGVAQLPKEKDLCSDSPELEVPDTVKDQCYSYNAVESALPPCKKEIMCSSSPAPVLSQTVREFSLKGVCVSDNKSESKPCSSSKEECSQFPNVSAAKNSGIPDTVKDISSCSKTIQEGTSSNEAVVPQTTNCDSVQGQTSKQIIRDANLYDSETTDAHKAKHIKKLEKLMAKIDKKIKKLQQKELSYSDMDEESDYTLEDRLKRRMLKVYEEWCRQVGCSAKAAFESHKQFHYEGSRYECINTEVEKFMNKKKIFPDFHDILNLVTDINVKNNLCLTHKMTHTIAIDVFKDIGQKLRERRFRDFIQFSGCYLTDNANMQDDPAEQNELMKKELAEHWKDSEKKLDELFQSFSRRQEELKNFGVTDEVSTSQDEDDEDGEEEEEEEEKLDSLMDVEDSDSGESNSCDRNVSGAAKVKEENVSGAAKVKEEDIACSSAVDEAVTKPSNIPNHISFRNRVNSRTVGDVKDKPRDVVIPTVDLPSDDENSSKPAVNLLNPFNITSAEISVIPIKSEKLSVKLAPSVIHKSSTNLQNISKNSVICTKVEKCPYSSSNSVNQPSLKSQNSVVPRQNGCKSAVSAKAVPKSSVLPKSIKSTIPGNYLLSSPGIGRNNNVTTLCHSKQSSVPAGSSSKLVKCGKEAGSNAVEIWIISSSDSDASTEPTPERQKKPAPKSKTNRRFTKEPSSSSSNMLRQNSRSQTNWSPQTHNSNSQSALKGVKRLSSETAQKQNHAHEKRVCHSSLSKS